MSDEPTRLNVHDDSSFKKTVLLDIGPTWRPTSF